jgi:hypothetical protein
VAWQSRSTGSDSDGDSGSLEPITMIMPVMSPESEAAADDRGLAAAATGGCGSRARARPLTRSLPACQDSGSPEPECGHRDRVGRPGLGDPALTGGRLPRPRPGQFKYRHGATDSDFRVLKRDSWNSCAGPRGARVGGPTGYKKDKFRFRCLLFVFGVCSDYNRAREPVARKFIAR